MGSGGHGMQGLAGVVIAVILGACLLVGCVVLYMAVPPEETVGEADAACGVVPDGSTEDRCLALARELVSYAHWRYRITARLLEGPPLRLCTRRAAAMGDAELRRRFAAWAEREARSGGARAMAYTAVVSFLEDEVGCE